MAKLRVPQKAQRVLELLIGLGHPRVREALAGHGFTDPAIRESVWAFFDQHLKRNDEE